MDITFETISHSRIVVSRQRRKMQNKKDSEVTSCAFDIEEKKLFMVTCFFEIYFKYLKFVIFRNTAAEMRKRAIQESKFLGGDMEHTHLVKGLDFALLQKVLIVKYCMWLLKNVWEYHSWSALQLVSQVIFREMFRKVNRSLPLQKSTMCSGGNTS